VRMTKTTVRNTEIKGSVPILFGTGVDGVTVSQREG
jgi:hypothetical protein